MPRKTLKQLAPSPAKLKEIGALRLLGDWLLEPNLWHINRFSASMAFFVGLFVAFLPLPGQTVVAAIMAIKLRCNLPLSVALVWITNPVTIPAIFYLAYKVGASILGAPETPPAFEPTTAWFMDSLTRIWQPLLLGSLICGLLFGSLGYFLINMLWRWRVSVHWRRRAERRARNRLTLSERDQSVNPGEAPSQAPDAPP